MAEFMFSFLDVFYFCVSKFGKFFTVAGSNQDEVYF